MWVLRFSLSSKTNISKFQFDPLYHEPLARVIAQARSVFDIKFTIFLPLPPRRPASSISKVPKWCVFAPSRLHRCFGWTRVNCSLFYSVQDCSYIMRTLAKWNNEQESPNHGWVTQKKMKTDCILRKLKNICPTLFNSSFFIS